GIFQSVDRGAAAVRRAASETHRFWMLRYLEQNADKQWRALAVRPIGRRWLVELLDLVFTVPMTHGTPFVEGQELVVEVGEVDARRDHLSLRLVSAV
ncbi:MAG: hypothetical protein VX938_04560, partial [Myxococcota bacterium]|nr:hypothetical protein [Myxococcota bacterium]